MPWHLCFFLFFVQTTVLTSLSQYAWLRPRHPPDEEKMAMRLHQSIFDSPCLWMIDWAVLQMPLRDSSAAIISVSITLFFIFLLRYPSLKQIYLAISEFKHFSQGLLQDIQEDIRINSADCDHANLPTTSPPTRLHAHPKTDQLGGSLFRAPFHCSRHTHATSRAGSKLGSP